MSAVHANGRTPACHGFNRAGALLALGSMLLASGSHWVLLQSLAFGSMIIRYAQDTPLRAAVAMTFDGKHPCPLCHAVQEGRQDQEERDSKLGLESRLDLGLASKSTSAPAWIVAGGDQSAPPPAWWPARRDAPPKPRPRAG